MLLHYFINYGNIRFSKDCFHCLFEDFTELAKVAQVDCLGRQQGACPFAYA
ncbi:hypothetical protein DFP77_11749 [Marinomonas foliarum]|uniref:Uncharacterized protein n=1 Tax=Marinomonas foliarum TaxID=491950 RepID=A0A368ZWF5_9GAMM|nr:hypothetical protein DFP77_11749 [Marinomonas foliarum]